MSSKPSEPAVGVGGRRTGAPLLPGRRPWRHRRLDQDAATVAAILYSSGSKRTNYVPVVPSPLRAGADGAVSSEGSDDSSEPPLEPPLVPRRSIRSLKIRVVGRPGPGLVEDGEGSLAGSEPSSPRNTLRRPSPAVSLQSVGRDFSRYPSRQPSGTLVDLATPSSLSSWTPGGLHVNGDVRQLGHGFDTSDPERGYSPYLQRQGPPVQYPSIDEKEDDDSLHNPDGEDDRHLGLKECFAHCSWRFLLTFMCFILLMIGPAVLFIVWPIVTYGHLGRDNSDREGEEISKHKHPILGAVRTSLIDPDTPKYAMTRDSVLGQGKLKLVFSDEFNQDGRTFYEGDDQFWQAADFHYAATNDLEWYDPDAITTANGTLQIKMQAIPNHNLDYRSGMLQSWNKMCFKGGVMEVSASLAGPAGVPGLWPGIWTLGNLARPGYRATSDGVWPYSYDQCDAGITPNQSSADGLSFLPGQRLAKCVCTGEDHPTPGRGRGAPEIDALEGAAEYDMRVGVVTQSSQVAPFDIWYRVDHNFLAIRDTKITQLNGWRGGPYQQAISGVTMLNNDWYDEVQYQKYAFEYIPGQEDGAIAWFVGDDETFRMSGKATGPNGNIGQRDISREPMSIILNLGMSSSWTWIDWATLGPRLAEGTTMYIDYVRIYQKEGEESITCDPPGYATTSYIRKHPKAYQNSNLTTWDDTGYPWPKNELMHGCE